MSCTAAEIAEKRRIAQEKLKAKKLLQPNNTVPSSSNNAVQAKSSQNFYKKLDNSNKGSEFLRVMHENKLKLNSLKDSRNSTHPYQKNQEKYEKKTEKYNSGVPSNETQQKLAPIFVNSINCTCYLVSDERFAVQPSSYLSKLIDVFKSIPSKSYDPNTRIWTFSIQDYDLVQTRVGAMKPNVLIGTIPHNVLKLCSQPKVELDFSCISSIESKLAGALLPFQKEGVCFGISKHGRVLIADEMGLGKTYQALAIADFYKDDWPLLICTSASTRDTWAKHIRTLLPYVACHHVACLTSIQDYFADCKVLITSYNLMEKNIDKILDKRFGVVVLDESHTLKSNKAKCTLMAERIARQAKRIILLSGTPALSRPVELFTQLKMIDRSFFNFIDYTTRYCEGKQTAFGWDATGQSNLQELNVVLTRKFMIRRVKADVLPELAEKMRETVMLDPALIWESNDTTDNLSSYAHDFSRSTGREKEEILLRFYAETAAAKAKAVCAYVKGLVKEKTKFIVFAHHQVMMDAISTCLKNNKVDFIRIDGSTKNDLRTQNVEKFQTNKSCQVALLSLKACNTGITLTAAQLVVFAELDWNPSTLAQAESRAHRIGQNSSVTCRYLLANKTADDVIWQLLKNKQDVLNKAGLFCEDLQDGEHVIGPTSSRNIKAYFTPTKKTNELDSSKNSISEKPAFSSASYQNDFEKNNSSTDENLQELLDEDEEDFASLEF